jgi:hypothetical protein
MVMSDSARYAATMGRRAGVQYRRVGIPKRNPFPLGSSPVLDGISRAWDLAYFTAAHPPPPGPPKPDVARNTVTVTASATGTDETALHALLAASVPPDPGYTGAVGMLYVHPDDAVRLAVDGGEPAADLHVTLFYLDRPADDYTAEDRAGLELKLGDVLADRPLPVTADGYATAHFNPDSAERDPAAVILVQSQELADLHDAADRVIEQMIGPQNPTFPIFVPHVTLAYNVGPEVIGADSLGPIRFDRLVMAWGETQTDISPSDPIADGPGDTFATEDPMTAPPETPTPAAPADPQPPTESAGRTWSGPLALLDTPSSDGRKLAGGGGTIRPLPLPISWQEKSDEHHGGSVVVGRILDAEIRAGQLWGHGDWLDPYEDNTRRAMAQVDAGLGLISVDTAPLEVSCEDETGQPIDPYSYEGDGKVIVVFQEWELGGATIVSFPAFAEARIANDQPAMEPDGMESPIMLPEDAGTFAGAAPGGPTVSADGTGIVLTDGTTVKVGDLVGVGDPDGDGDVDTGTVTGINTETRTVTVTLTPDDDDAEGQTVTVDIADLVPGAPDQNPPGLPAAPAMAVDQDIALLASSAINPYNSAFFEKRELFGPTPLTVNRETGEVYGHFGQWGECHIGKLAEAGVCTTVPESKAGYDYFHLGEVITDQGPLPVGKITVGRGHYGSHGGIRGANEHYDQTGTIVAVVRAYEDAYGGQFAGQLLHGISAEQVDSLMAAGQVSGDWRTIKGNLELVHILGVNVPGFPNKRPTPVWGIEGGRQISLVAAGVVAPDVAEEVTLPSGKRMPRDDWDTLVAAAVTAIDRNTARQAHRTEQTLNVADQLALSRTRARARLALIAVQ